MKHQRDETTTTRHFSPQDPHDPTIDTDTGPRRVRPIVNDEKGADDIPVNDEKAVDSGLGTIIAGIIGFLLGWWLQ